MKHLQQVIDVYLAKNIPFAVFKYPNEKTKLIAQYANNYITDEVDFGKHGFLIHPFIKDEKTPVALIRPEVFTTNFNTVNLKDVSKLPLLQQTVFNETTIDYASYKNTLQKQLSLLKTNVLSKIVLSRIVTLPKIEVDTLAEKYNQLCIKNPNAFCYLFNLPGIGLWLGATPEILLKYQNNLAETVALAGTKKIDKKKNWGEKEIEEQALVSEYIAHICQNLNHQIKNKSNAETITAGNIQHLKTTYKIEISPKNLSQFIKLLHPTPAVAGLPKEKAIQYILKSENYHRQYYTGFLGMVKPDKMQLYVNLRCAKITQNNTLAFVGGGITKSSNIENEWEETVAKSKTIANIL